MDNFCVIIWLNKKREKPLHSNMNFTGLTAQIYCQGESASACADKPSRLFVSNISKQKFCDTRFAVCFDFFRLPFKRAGFLRSSVSVTGASLWLSRQYLPALLLKGSRFDRFTLGSLFVLIFWPLATMPVLEGSIEYRGSVILGDPEADSGG